MPSESPIRIGVVGPGWWAARYLLPPLLDHPSAEVRALCGRDAGRVRAAAEAAGIPHAYVSVEDMIEDVGLDALIVASPPSSHLPAVTAGAARGLHVFCEKPLARSATETAAMVRACERVRTVAGFTQRWHPAVRLLKTMAVDGAIGEVLHIRYTTRATLAADPRAPWDWRHDADEYSYGVLSDLGPHAVDLVRWIGGEIASVQATAHTVFSDRQDAHGALRPVGNWDDATMEFESENGPAASVTMTRTMPRSTYRRFHHELDVVGTRGTLTYTSDRPAEVIVAETGGEPKALRPSVPGLEEAAAGSFEEIMAVMNEGARRQAADMLDAFAGRPVQEVPTLTDGHIGQQVLDAAAVSARTHAEVRVRS
ncbi:Gfo/Idh/MocA family oxidoreductase [Streptomyces sp. NBC_01390]|uniref:Gfo/Idh/MocA family protein n=1 Tax=Streptomyces sp. NBC_01390 TaxID=2903850 RepID=UPI0032545499